MIVGIGEIAEALELGDDIVGLRFKLSNFDDFHDLVGGENVFLERHLNSIKKMNNIPIIFWAAKLFNKNSAQE